MKSRGSKWRPISNMCLALAVASLLVVALDSVVRAGEAPRRQIIFLFDNSRSMYVGTEEGSGDPNGQAHKMARLMVRYLQSMVTDGRYEIGAANFSSSTEDYASDYRVLMPIKSAEAWSEYDIAQLQPLSCPGTDDPRKGVSGRDPCLGTFRSSAIGWAEGQLESCPMNDDQMSCLVVMFTDDQTVESYSETQDEIRQTLQRLPGNIDFHIVVFPEDDAENIIWDTWSTEDRLVADTSLVQTPVINTDVGSTTDIYRQMIDVLAISGSSARDIILDLPSQKRSLARWYAPNVNLVEMDLISSASMLSETYETKPDIWAGNKRLWYLPEVTDLNAAFEGNRTTDLYDVAVLRILTHTMPVDTEVVFWPERPQAGQPISIRALVHAGARLLFDTDQLTLTAQLLPDGPQANMRPDPDSGLWTGILAAPRRSGDFELEVRVTALAGLASEHSQTVTRSLRLEGSQWNTVLVVDPPIGLAGQIRSFELVATLNGQFANLPPGTAVKARFSETGEEVVFHNEYGNWRAKHPVNRTQNVVAVVQIGGLDEFTSAVRAVVADLPLARIDVSGSSRVLGVPFPVPGESISITVGISSAYEITPVLYASHGRGPSEVLALEKVDHQRYVGHVTRPWDFSGVKITSDNVQLVGKTAIRGEMLILVTALLVLGVAVFIMVVLRLKMRDRDRTLDALDKTIRGDPNVLADLIRTHTVHDDKVRMELSRVLARYIAKQGVEV